MGPFKIGLLLSSLFTIALAQSISTEILYWPISDPEPSVLAHVSYDPKSSKLDLISYSPAAGTESAIQDAQNEPQGLVRVGLYVSTPTNSKQWVGTVTSPSVLRGDGLHNPTLRLHLDPANEIYYVSVVLSPSSFAPSSSPPNALVQLVRDEAGPRPQLNRPVVVGPDGKNPEELPEKTLFQKYWWVFLVITFIAMSGGGEGR